LSLRREFFRPQYPAAAAPAPNSQGQTLLPIRKSTSLVSDLELLEVPPRQSMQVENLLREQAWTVGLHVLGPQALQRVAARMNSRHAAS